MKKPSILGQIVILSIIFASLHAFALKFSIYYTVLFSDWAMHFFGGFLGALIVLYVLAVLGLSPKSLPKRAFLMLFVTMCVFSVAVVWELWEIYVGFTDPLEDGWVHNTVGDLVMGVAGAIVAFFYYDKKHRIHAE